MKIGREELIGWFLEFLSSLNATKKGREYLVYNLYQDIIDLEGNSIGWVYQHFQSVRSRFEEVFGKIFSQFEIPEECVWADYDGSKEMKISSLRNPNWLKSLEFALRNPLPYGNLLFKGLPVPLGPSVLKYEELTKDDPEYFIYGYVYRQQGFSRWALEDIGIALVEMTEVDFTRFKEELKESIRSLSREKSTKFLLSLRKEFAKIDDRAIAIQIYKWLVLYNCLRPGYDHLAIFPFDEQKIDERFFFCASSIRARFINRALTFLTDGLQRHERSHSSPLTNTPEYGQAPINSFWYTMANKDPNALNDLVDSLKKHNFVSIDSDSRDFKKVFQQTPLSALKPIKWIGTATSLHCFIDLLIEHEKIDDCDRWKIAEACFVNKDGLSFQNLKSFNKAPKAGTIAILKDFVTALP